LVVGVGAVAHALADVLAEALAEDDAEGDGLAVWAEVDVALDDPLGDAVESDPPRVLRTSATTATATTASPATTAMIWLRR